MFEEYQYHMAANSVIKCGRAHPDLPAVICIHSQWFTAVFPSETEPVCVCYGSIASAFAVLLITNGRESVGMRESASNLRGLCVRGSLWPDVNIMNSAMWDKRCWLITSPGRCPFLFSSRLSASVFYRVQSRCNYSFCGGWRGASGGFIRLGRPRFDHPSPALTGICSSPQIKRNLPRLDKHLSQTVVWFASLVLNAN